MPEPPDLSLPLQVSPGWSADWSGPQGSRAPGLGGLGESPMALCFLYLVCRFLLVRVFFVWILCLTVLGVSLLLCASSFFLSDALLFRVTLLTP